MRDLTGRDCPNKRRSRDSVLGTSQDLLTCAVVCQSMLHVVVLIQNYQLRTWGVHAEDCISAASPHLESHAFEAMEFLRREPNRSSSESPPKSTRALFLFWVSQEEGSISVSDAKAEKVRAFLGVRHCIALRGLSGSSHNSSHKAVARGLVRGRGFRTRVIPCSVC